jgi:hypothetical protein
MCQIAGRVRSEGNPLPPHIDIEWHHIDHFVWPGPTFAKFLTPPSALLTWPWTWRGSAAAENDEAERRERVRARARGRGPAKKKTRGGRGADDDDDDNAARGDDDDEEEEPVKMTRKAQSFVEIRFQDHYGR